MESTGNANRLKHDSTIIEGAQIRLGADYVNRTGPIDRRQAPTAIYLLLGVCCLLQILQLFYLANCKADLALERLQQNQAVEQQAEKTARRAALDALDCYMHGKRSDFDSDN